MSIARGSSPVSRIRLIFTKGLIEGKPRVAAKPFHYELFRQILPKIYRPAQGTRDVWPCTNGCGRK